MCRRSVMVHSVSALIRARSKRLQRFVPILKEAISMSRARVGRFRIRCHSAVSARYTVP